MVFAMRVLDARLTESQIQNMQEDELEKDLVLIGVVGSADKMQEDVRSCVSEFIGAGIKVWIVTGDKDSTAKAVGYNSGIMSPEREIL